MSRILAAGRNGVAALVVAGVLGFGVAQTLARPAEAAEAGAVRACTTENCTNWCRSRYGPDAYGTCTSTGSCLCYL